MQPLFVYHTGMPTLLLITPCATVVSNREVHARHLDGSPENVLLDRDRHVQCAPSQLSCFFQQLNLISWNSHHEHQLLAGSSTGAAICFVSKDAPNVIKHSRGHRLAAIKPARKTGYRHAEFVGEPGKATLQPLQFVNNIGGVHAGGTPRGELTGSLLRVILACHRIASSGIFAFVGGDHRFFSTPARFSHATFHRHAYKFTNRDV